MKNINYKRCKKKGNNFEILTDDFKRIFKNTASDNGSEFMDSKGIESLGITHFYDHGYCSYEKGINIGKFSDEAIKTIE